MQLRGKLTGIAAAQQRLRSAEQRLADVRANPKSPGSGRTGALGELYGEMALLPLTIQAIR